MQIILRVICTEAEILARQKICLADAMTKLYICSPENGGIAQMVRAQDS